MKRFALALLVIVATAAPCSGVRAAEVSLDIPGTPWVGGAVTSTVGGAIYDRVWRLELAQPRILVAKLTGSAGAELGLYLFDDSAASVASDAPIASSALPGGIQRLYLPLQAGTYYIDVNGRNPTKPYVFTLSVSLLEDRTPPALSIAIAGGEGRISSPQTSVNVDARDALSGVSDIRYAIDGAPWGDWFPYGPVVAISFEPTEGIHRIAVQARNPLGLESIVVEESVILDLTAPLAELLAPLGEVASVARPTITYRFSEAMSSRSVIAGGVQLFLPGGDPVAGTTIYAASTRTARFTPRDPLVPGVQYLFQVGGATDVAGNFVADPLIRPIIRVVPTSISLVARSAASRGIAATTIVANTIGLPKGSEVLVERLVSTDPLTGEATWETEIGVASGVRTVRATVQPNETSRYRLRYLGDAGHAPSTSLPFTVTVRPTLRLVGTSTVRSTTRGSVILIRGTVAPAGTSVALILYRCGQSYVGCTRVEKVELDSDSAGAIEHLWTAPDARGRWTWRLKVGGSTSFLTSTSAPLRISVR